MLISVSILVYILVIISMKSHDTLCNAKLCYVTLLVQNLSFKFPANGESLGVT